MSLPRASNRLTKKIIFLVLVKANDFKKNRNLPVIEIAEKFRFPNDDDSDSSSNVSLDPPLEGCNKLLIPANDL